MSLCCLMVYDFKEQWGRFDEDGGELYSDMDLRFGINYAEGFLEEGVTYEPFHRYDFRAFIAWAKEQLKGGPMPLFRKKPSVIEAVQYKEYGKLVLGMCNSQTCYASGKTEPHVHTMHDGQIVILAVGDWIVPESDGEHYYPIKDSEIDRLYDRVPEMCTCCGRHEPEPLHPNFLCMICIQSP